MTLFAFLPLGWALGAVAGAVAIPIVIHLINRRRFKIVPWAAMKFLLQAQKQTRKRMRIEQLLLLLCRIMILVGIIFAMASVMDYAEKVWAFLDLTKLGPGKKMAQHRTHHIFVLDASLSMNQKTDGDQTAFEVARQQVLRKIADNASGDGYSVLLLKESPVWLIGEASQDARKVVREIEAVKPSHGNASVPAALTMISGKLSEASGRFPMQAVYFFTDMQQSTWQGTPPTDLKAEADDNQKNPYLDIQKKATTVFVDCGPQKDNGNLAVTHLEFDLSRSPYITTGLDLTLLATVKNYGTESKKVRADLLIGKAKDSTADGPLQMRVSADEPRTIEPNSQQTIAFDKVRFDKPGTYAVQVKLPDDALTQDNARTIIITVRDTIPVLLVNGKQSADRFEQAAEYLRLVLNPFTKPGTEEKWAPLRPKVVLTSEFMRMTEEQLEPFDCIFWCDVPEFGVSQLRKIDTHLRRGGGFVISLGEKSGEKIDAYNQLLYKEGHGLMPAELKKRIEAPPEHNFYLQNTDANAFSLPPLAAFSDDRDRLTLRSARFRQYIQAVVPEGKARTVLWFAPEYTPSEKVKRDDTLPASSPAIVEWNPPLSRAHQPAPAVLKPGQRAERQQALRYRGKVILLTSTVNMDWSSWPSSPSYGAMMHELTRLALSGRLREQSQPVGGVLDAFLPGGAELAVTVKFPAEIEGAKPGKVQTQLIDDVNYFRWADTDFAGVYRAETPDGHEIPFAVNVPTSSVDQKGSESDLTRIDLNKLREGYPGWDKLQLVRDPLLAMLGDSPVNSEAVNVPQPVGPFLANIALLIVLGLLFIEIVMAWHFGHYTTTEGAIAQSTPSPIVTMIAVGVAVFSVIVVGIGAFVLVHERQHGDFLGFLPDIVRAWFEFIMNIQPPSAGEGRNWPLEQQTYLFDLPGPEHWYAVLISVAAAVTIFFTYKAEAPRVSLLFKMLLGAVRLCLILATLWFLLPRHQIHYARQAWPDLVILIDDTRSMGEADTFHDAKVIDKVKELSASIKEKLRKDLPDKIAALRAEIAAKNAAADKEPELRLDFKAEADGLQKRLQYWQKQQDDLTNEKWRPSRLQLVQAILAQEKPHWLKTLLAKKESKIHIFHLDITGRATKLRDLDGDAGDIVDPTAPKQIERASKAIDKLEPYGEDSRLGMAVRDVINHYNGSALSSVIMFTDGVTTREETLSQVADYAAQRGISLFFVGVGDQNEQRDLKIHDLNVDDPIYLGDTAVFEARVTGHGYKDVTVPVILKLRGKDGKEREVAREKVKIDPAGKSVKVRLRHQPKEMGQHPYIIEVEPPKLEANEKPLPAGNLRLEKTIEVIDTKLIRVLFVEGQPRYEYRYLKFLLEREAPDKNKKKSIELKVVLLDADEEFAEQDKTALRNFPPTLDGQDGLNQYDVLILGDCDPNHPKLRNRLKDIAAYVRGEDEKGRKASKPGGGLLFIAGAFHNPHSYKGTPLAEVMPVEPIQNVPPKEINRIDRMRPDLTPAGKMHPIFRFGPDEAESASIWNRLTPMFWYSGKYRTKPLAEVLAVHPTDKAEFKNPNEDARHPLVVQQFVGTGRSMFFGFDESWRWRLREDEAKYNNFWIQTMRYLSRGRSTRTELRLDRQTPYRVGENIKVTVRFPDNTPGGGAGGANQPGPKVDNKTKVEVTVVYLPLDAKEGAGSEKETLRLAKVEGSWGTFEGIKDRTREGKYRFRLTNPDVSSTQPDGEKPTAEAVVELPPGELDRLRMDYQEMTKAAHGTNGEFYTLANADKLLEDIPRGSTVAISSQVPPTLLWNQWWVLVIIVLLITSEWVLRKMKHLL